MEKPDEAAEQLFEGALAPSPHERRAFLDRAACIAEISRGAARGERPAHWT
jgi:hypothetical protein